MRTSAPACRAPCRRRCSRAASSVCRRCRAPPAARSTSPHSSPRPCRPTPSPKPAARSASCWRWPASCSAAPGPTPTPASSTRAATRSACSGSSPRRLPAALAVPPALLASRPLSDVAAFLDGASDGAPPGAVAAACCAQDVERLAEQIHNGRSCPPPAAPHQPDTILLTGATGFFRLAPAAGAAAPDGGGDRLSGSSKRVAVRNGTPVADPGRTGTVVADRRAAPRRRHRRGSGVAAPGIVGAGVGPTGPPHRRRSPRRGQRQPRASLRRAVSRKRRRDVRGAAPCAARAGRSGCITSRRYQSSSPPTATAAWRSRRNDLSQTRWVHGGYAQSKYASEWLVRRASTGGVTCYRPGLIHARRARRAAAAARPARFVPARRGEAGLPARLRPHRPAPWT